MEKEGYLMLVKELYEEFKLRGLLLSIVVSHDKTIIDYAYDMIELIKYVDWISVMTYDYHTYYDGRTGHIAPLTTMDGINVDVTIKHLIKMGVIAKKIILGIPTYGRTFTLRDMEKHTLNTLVTGPGIEGLFTKHRGLLGYYEICMYMKHALHYASTCNSPKKIINSVNTKKFQMHISLFVQVKKRNVILLLLYVIH